MKIIWVLLILLLCPSWSLLAGNHKEGRLIPQGRFSPLYGIEKDQKDFLIKAFVLDIYPVTVADFNLFLKSHPEWSKDKIPGIYADKNYLTNKKHIDKSPVVFISWFAANAYCESKKGRLPSTLEWEYVAAADEISKDASKTESFKSKILNWYSTPENEEIIQVVGKSRGNIYGIHDLHGLIWEWTSDFNSVIMTSDNRDDGDKQRGFYCGASSIGSRNKDDYAGFIRYSLRSSLKGDYTLTNLGFRCAYDL